MCFTNENSSDGVRKKSKYKIFKNGASFLVTFIFNTLITRSVSPKK